MARITDDNNGGQGGSYDDGGLTTTIEAFGHEVIDLPGSEFVKDANVSRDGQDLVLEGPAGMTVVIEGYFNAEPAPMLTAPDGTTLTPNLVNSFVSQGPGPQYADMDSAADASPVGSIEDISGSANIIRTDGRVEQATLGTAVYQGDVVETEGDGAVNIVFIDESSFAISENAKMAIDEFIFNPSAENGSSNFSILRGIFMFTSGLIGRDDPDDVEIDTPHGSIGIRGTTIAGNADTGEITVLEGAIVLRGFGGGELTLAQQFDTAKFDATTGEVIYLGKADMQTLSDNFGTMKGITPSTFISMGDDGGDSGEAPQVADAQDQTDSSEDETGDEPTQTASLDDDTQDGGDGTTDETGTEEDSSEGENTAEDGETVEVADSETTDDTIDSTDDGTDGDDGTITLASNDTGDDTTSFDGRNDTSFDGSDDTFDSSTGDTGDTTTSDTSTSDTSTSGSDTTDTTTSDTGTSDTSTSDSDTTTTDPTVITGNPPSGTGGDIGTIYAPLTQQTVFANGSVLPNIDVSGRFADADGDITSIAITGIQQDGNTISPAWITDGGGGLINFGPVPDAFMPTDGSSSTISIRVTATDSNGNTGSANFNMFLLAASAPALQGTTGGDPGLAATGVSEVAVGLAGDDTISLSGLSSIGFGGTGADTFTQSGNSSKAIGEGGNDVFNVTGDGVEVFAGAGDDTVNVGLSTNHGGTYFGGSDISLGDTIDYTGATNVNFITVTLNGLNFSTVSLDGVTADDTIRGFENVTGTGGDDTITGDARDNVLTGGAGNDTLDGGAGDDTLNGGAGDDLFINSAGIDFYDGGTAGETNGDTIDFSGAAGAVDVDLSATTINNDGFGNTESIINVENIIGTGFNDTITGDNAANNISGGAGNDAIDGGGGDDTLNGGAGNDTYYAQNFDGSDSIIDSGGIDTYNAAAVTAVSINYNLNASAPAITAGTDIDTFAAGTIENFVDGAMSGSFSVTALNGNRTMDGGGGTDSYGYFGGTPVTITLTGAAAATVSDGGDTDTLISIEDITGDSVSDETFVVNDINAAHTIFGGAAGTDVLSFAPLGAVNVHYDAFTGAATINGGGTITASDIETLIGNTGNNHFDANGIGANTTYNLSDSTNIVISGGINITLQDFDEVTGTTGFTDTVDFSGAGAGVTVDLSAGDANGITINNMENVTGSGFNDTLTGDAFNNTINAGAGDDTVFSSDGTDTYQGGAGIDTLDFSAATQGAQVNIGVSFDGIMNDGFGNVETVSVSGFENVTGSAFSDIISGNFSGTHTLSGMDGADIFQVQGATFTQATDGNALIFDGGNGMDTLEFTNGGAGNFDINPDGVEDIINSVETYDFALNAQSDVIDVNIRNFMLDNNTAQTLDIQVDDADDLALDFIDGGYSYESGAIAAGDMLSFSDGMRTVNVNFGGAFNGVFNVTGLAANTALNLNEIAAGLNDINGFAIIDDIGQGFGNVIGSLGDQDGDGFDDIRMVQGSDTEDGDIFTVSGGTALTNNTAPNTFSYNVGFTTASGIDTGPITNTQISAIGDFDGDGSTDFIVSAPNADSTSADSGQAFIVNNSGTVIANFDGMATGDQFGKSISGIGDVNGDGYADVLIGAPNVGGGGEGAAYLLFGDAYTPTATVDVGTFDQGQVLNNASVAFDNARDVVHMDNGTSEFIISLSDGALEFTNVDDPGAPTAKTSFADGNVTGLTSYFGAADPLNGAVDMALDGTDLYILSNNTSTGTTGQITVLDMSAPGTPVFVDSFESAGLLGATSMDVDPFSGMAVVGKANGDVHIVDLGATATNDGSILGTINLSAVVIEDVVVTDDNFAFVAAGNTIQAIDYTTAASPAAGDAAALPSAKSLFYDDFTEIVYAVGDDGTNGTLNIYDFFGDPNSDGNMNFDLLASIDLDADGLTNVTDVFVEDGIAYIMADGQIGMYDVHDPAAISFIGSIADASMVSGAALTVEDGFVYTVTDDGAAGGDALTTIDAIPDGIRIDGLTTSDLLGTNVSGAGDVNADGLSDFLISVPTSSGGAGAGTVYLVYGRHHMGDVDLTNTMHAQEITGINVDGADLDIGIEYMGDMDGNGSSDFVIVEDNGINGDRMRIFYGESLGGPGSASINVTSADMTIHTTAGELIGGGFGGDFNGDGFDDGVVVVNDGSNIADIYVIYGNSGLGATVDVSTDLDATNSFHMTYDFSADDFPANFEFIISSAGDLNGDGFEDITIGLPDADNTGTDDGTVINIYGQADGSSAYNFSTNSAASNEILIGTDGMDTLDQTNAAHSNLVFRGGAGDDVIAITDNSFAKIDGGGGINDLIGYEGGATLDLRAFTAEDIQRIEGIDLGADGSTLLMTGDNVHNLLSSSDDGSLSIFNSAPATDGIILFEDNSPLDHEPRAFLGADGVDDFAKMVDSETTPTWDAVFDGSGTVDYTIGGKTFSIHEDFFMNGNVIIGNNFVQDGDAADSNANAGQVDATANEQTLVGSSTADSLNGGNGAFTDVSMFGLGGDDTFEVTNGNFDVIDGGAGTNDSLSFRLDDGALDLSSFSRDEIRNIEQIMMDDSSTGGADGGQTITLTLDNVLNMLESSDNGNTLRIMSNGDNDNGLIFDDLDGADTYAGGGDSTANMTAALGASGVTNDGTVYQFNDVDGNTGWTLEIDMALFDTNNNVDIV